MTTAEREQQRTEALELANYIRHANANLRRELEHLSHKDGCDRVACLLIDPSGPIASIPVGRLLLSIRTIGEYGMSKYLRAAGIFSPSKRVGKLTPRQRQALAHTLRNRDLLYPGTFLA